MRGRIVDRNGEVLADSQRVGELAERTYAYPPLAHVTGYVSTRYGKTGIEEGVCDYVAAALLGSSAATSRRPV